MAGEGWIKLHRRFLKWEWYGSLEMKALFLHLLLVANHNGKTWRGITVSRGQVITTRESLASETGIPARSIRTCLDHLVKTGEIEKESPTKHFTLITILNYDRYQLNELESIEEESANQTSFQSPTNGQQSANASNGDTNSYEVLPPTNGQQSANQASIQPPQTINKEYIYNKTTQSWRYLSSVQKSICAFDKDRMAEMKRDIFRQEVESYAADVGMNPSQVTAFVRHWTEHNPGSDKIRAEGYDPFNTKERMISWMERERPESGVKVARTQQTDRIQAIIDERNKFQQAINGFINPIPKDGAPNYQGK